jgi:hypothetical protein
MNALEEVKVIEFIPHKNYIINIKEEPIIIIIKNEGIVHISINIE